MEAQRILVTWRNSTGSRVIRSHSHWFQLLTSCSQGLGFSQMPQFTIFCDVCIFISISQFGVLECGTITSEGSLPARGLVTEGVCHVCGMSQFNRDKILLAVSEWAREVCAGWAAREMLLCSNGGWLLIISLLLENQTFRDWQSLPYSVDASLI